MVNAYLLEDAGEVTIINAGVPATTGTSPWSLEPKWGGFWTIVCCDGDEVELGSGRERPLTRSFPEVVEAVRAELPPRCGVDAEIVVLTPTAGGSTSTRCCCAATPAAGRVRLWLSRFRPG